MELAGKKGILANLEKPYEILGGLSSSTAMTSEVVSLGESAGERSRLPFFAMIRPRKVA